MTNKKHEEEYDEDAICNNDANEHSKDCQSDTSNEELNVTDEQNQDNEAVEQKLADVQDKYIRLVAEFDNYRKRTSRERLDLIMTAGEGVIVGLLPILDDFERAIKAMEAANDIEAVKEGTMLIYSKLVDCLKSKGLQEIDPQYTEFNTDLHDAVTKFPAPTPEQKNKIIDTVQKGYKLNDKVIRHAKVVVGE
ncbi:MAG: nucleotide exchange factor GrpE [Prevotellaceae bacterium]|nr:nucleotide exchange factor GrpE [Prevotellaceae bacterium]